MLHTTIEMLFAIIPYVSHKRLPDKIRISINKDTPLTFFSLIDLINCGRALAARQIPATKPIISIGLKFTAKNIQYLLIFLLYTNLLLISLKNDIIKWMKEKTMFESAKEVLKIFSDNGFEAYMVGGFVRDYLLRLPSHDIDITTNAMPEIVKGMFKDNYNLSNKFKTVTIRYNGYEFEVTTYRYDKSYADHRHPKTVVASKLSDDIKRRDFTINSLCMDKDENIIDLVDGKKDIELRVVRAVGDPNKRFNEDALRMMRAFRFAARLNFTIEDKTYKAIKLNSHLMSFLSKERIRSELDGILDAEYLKDLIIPMLKSHIFRLYKDVELAFKTLYENYKKLDTFRFIVLASMLKGSVTNEILLSKKEIDGVKKTIKFAELIKTRQLSPVAIFEENPKYVYDAYDVLEVLDITPYKRSDIDEIVNSLKYKTRKEIDIDGNDIMALIPKSPKDIGKYLDCAYTEVIMERIPNKKEVIMEYVKELYKTNLENDKKDE